MSYFILFSNTCTFIIIIYNLLTFIHSTVTIKTNSYTTHA
uniref:CSON011862 protein n=1 Tax=Culicoides sonorensis TaxID=179676 RepID=A0A336N0M7_CULSO